MNLLEQKMLNVLKSLRDDYGVIGIKAELSVLINRPSPFSFNIPVTLNSIPLILTV